MRLLRVFGLGWALHFKQESRNPFYLWIVIGTPIIYATMAYFLFRRGTAPGTLVTAALGSALMGIWSLTTTAAAAALHRQRRLGILELLVAAPTPLWAVIAPITIAITTVGVYSLVTGLLYVRLLFGVPATIENLGAFAAATPVAILSVGMLGFLMSAAFVRYRAAWQVGNLFEFPVWTVCGFLVPLTVLPGWIGPIAWALAPTWGMNALRDAALGLPAWPDIGMCIALSVAYGALGGLLLRWSLGSARAKATLALT
jgi:ABC-2 type transport system permease protein